MHKKKVVSYFIAITLAFLFFWIGYKVQRHETATLLIVYAALFFLYASIIIIHQPENVNFWVGCSIVFRVILLFSMPNLSEDFYRFIWDGHLLASGYHPFAQPPSYYIENSISISELDELIFSKLNSKDYFTIYPPIAQAFFWLSAKISSSLYGSLIVLKTINVIAEIGSIILLQKILLHFNLRRERVLIYALNPLIIIELTGNAHFESVMIFFILLSLYCMIAKRPTWSAVSMALSIGIKLIPAIFLPALTQMYGVKNSLRYYGVIVIVSLLFFLPLLDHRMLTGFQNSLPYFFSRFEFNASIYYLVRELGYLLVGFNIIYAAGPLLAVIAFFLILYVSIKGLPRIFFAMAQEVLSLAALREWRFIHTVGASLLIYYLFTTTLHPWYISTLLAVSVVTRFNFVIVWTFMIFLTYAGYHEHGFSENLWLIALEYLVVLGFFAYELWKTSTTLATTKNIHH